MAADDKQPLQELFPSIAVRAPREAAMRTSLALFVSVLTLAACQSVPEKTAQLEEPRERCDTVLTGSRIPQCNRGDVRIMTRQEVEQAGMLSNPAASDADTPLRPGRSH
jgi:hypothetical protein